MTTTKSRSILTPSYASTVIALVVAWHICHFCHISADWPQWLGPARSAHTDEPITAQAIEKPAALWRLSVGGGFSSPIVVGDRLVYTDEDGAREVARCVDAKTGKAIWQTPYADMFGDEWGRGPRSTPFSDGERVYVQSCNGEFHCLRISDGKILWGFKFADYGVSFLGSKAREGTASRRGNNGSGLVDRDAVIVPVGSKDGAALVCLDKIDGTLRWKAGDDEAAYSSLVVAEIAGARQVVWFNADSLLGADRVTGKTLWRVPLVTNAKRHTMTPVVDGNRVFVNSHTLGLICFEISQENGLFSASERWRNVNEKINLATPVLVDGHLYSYGANRNLVCVDAATGERKWTQPGFGTQLSTIIAAPRSICVLTDSGEAVLISPNPDRYVELARAQLVGKNWNYPAISDGKLYLRDQRELVCYSAR